MAAFTKISEDETPCISINPLHTISNINDNIYGGFTEHMGRCIYGGIYDPGNSLSDDNGFRKDVIEAMKELNTPVVRYPGGNFVATYHWLDGVGPKKNRPRRPELAWLGEESNEFGTDEFMKWCSVVGCEPYICLNFGTGTLDEALGWLEYCNSSKNTYYANLRRQNGREDPYNVKYWALGNEVWGPWQIEQTTREVYAHKAYQWAKALKLLDPNIVLILCGQDGTSTWDSFVLKECVRWEIHGLGGLKDRTLIDMHSIHVYTASSEFGENVTAPRGAERAIQITASLIDLARIENKVPITAPRPVICFDEWNVWDPSRAPGEQGAEEKYTLSDALAVSAWLNVFIRQSQSLGMCNIAQSVNVISPLLTTPTSLIKQSTYYPLFLFSRYMRGQTIAVQVRCGEYTGSTKPEWIRGTIATPWLDVSAALDTEGWVGVAVVNIHEVKEWKTEINGIKEGVTVNIYTVTGHHINATNTDGIEEVGIQESLWDGKGLFIFPKHSFTLLRWRA